jgi:cyclase
MTSSRRADPIQVERLAEGVHAFVAREPAPPVQANALCVQMGDALLIVDSGASEEGGRIILDAAARVSGGKPVRWLVLTHHHADHAAGRAAFPDSTTIVATERAARHLASRRGASRLPELLVADRRFAIEGGGRRAELLRFERGHSDGDLAVWLPAERVLATGDLCFNGHFGWMGDGWTPEWIDALGGLAALEPALVVPGHGGVADLETLRLYRRFLRLVRLRVGRLMARGVSRDRIAEEFEPPDFCAGWGMRDLLPGGLRRVFDEMSGVAHRFHGGDGGGNGAD